MCSGLIERNVIVLMRPLEKKCENISEIENVCYCMQFLLSFVSKRVAHSCYRLLNHCTLTIGLVIDHVGPEQSDSYALACALHIVDTEYNSF